MNVVRYRLRGRLRTVAAARVVSAGRRVKPDELISTTLDVSREGVFREDHSRETGKIVPSKTVDPDLLVTTRDIEAVGGAGAAECHTILFTRRLVAARD